MICRDKIIFSSLIACGLGTAGGYLFSSQFCKVTIIKRVAKEIALNQTLRQLFTDNAFYMHHYIRSVFFNAPDQTAIAQRLSKNQSDFATILRAYYGATRSDQFKQLMATNTALIAQLVTATKENASIADSTNALKQNSNEIAALLYQLNPTWQENQLKMGFENQLSYLMQQVESLQKNNAQRGIELFDAHLEQLLQRADEFDRGITAQFPEKF